MTKKQLVYVTLFILCTTFSFLYAQSPALVIKEGENKHKSLRLSELKIDVHVVGNIAVTTMEMAFYNETARVLEGSLYFPLDEGQTVSRFAMDVNGKLREGVVVEKEKGRQVFESIVRQNIDPGLLEWTKGNNFKARVYPIPSRGYKRLLIAYEQELKDAGKGFVYSLPLDFKDKVDTFFLNIEVIKQELSPYFDKENQLDNLIFEKWQESYKAGYNQEKYLPNKRLSFMLPKTAAYKQVVVEKDKDGKSYFYIHLNPEITEAKKQLPGKILLAWDVSASAAGRDLNKEIALLDSYFQVIGSAKIQLVVFSNEVHEEKDFSLKKGDWNTLKAALAGINYDGGTQLGSLDLSRYSCDEVLLSTDGVSNFGESEINLGPAPVMVINSADTANHSYLNFVAQKTGGVYLNLKKKNRKECLALLQNQSFTFIRADYKNNQIKETYPTIKTAVTGDFSLSGILKSDSAEITLHFGMGSKVLYSQKFTLVRPEEVREDQIIKRVWAQKKITELDMQFEKYRDQITDLGKKYSIVTRNTSLIVLDRLEDYVQHQIVPPKELQDEYFKIVENQLREEERATRSHIEEVVNKFKEMVKWYNTKFSMNKKQKIVEKKEMARNEEREMRRDMEEMAEEEEVMADHMEGADDESPTMDARDKSKDDADDTGDASSITLQKWTPDTPYLKELNKAKDAYKTYLKLRKSYANSSAFFLDVSDFFMEKGDKKTALRVLSNIAEMELENHQLLRILGHRLSQLEYYKLSISVFTEVLGMRGEEPQSYRDLALVYEKNKEYQMAVDLLYEVVKRGWDSRFPDIELIAVVEMNSILSRNPGLNTSKIDRRLIKNMPVDIRVILNWDADNCDMDLWVTNPNDEKCYYGFNRTELGGRMSRDFTRGYGPEEYMLHRAKDGTYKIEVNYYGNTQQVIAGATTIQVSLFLNYGKKNQVVKEITMRLKDSKEVVFVGTFEIKNGKIQ